jgi:elongation factor G
MHANKREEIRKFSPATSAPAWDLKNVTTGDTICDEKHPIVLESIEFPEPVIAGRRGAQDQERPGKDGRGAQQAGAGRPDLPGATDPGQRPDDHQPAWANCTWRSSSTA